MSLTRVRRPTVDQPFSWTTAIAWAGLALAAATAAAYAVSMIVMYVNTVPALQPLLDVRFPAAQTFTRFASISFDVYGRLLGWDPATNGTGANATSILTLDPEQSIVGSRQLLAQAPLSISATSISATVALRNSTAAAGTYENARLTIDGVGTVQAIETLPAATAADIAATGGSIQAALNSNFLVIDASPALPGARKLMLDPAMFTTVNNGTFYQVSLEPSAVRGLSFTYPTEIVFDSARGAVQSVTSGPAPGTPGGAATLDGDGRIPPSQLPTIEYPPQFVRGLWDADANVPFLSNANCGANDTFIYIVNVGGNTTLGNNSYWVSGDRAICFHGAWSFIRTASVVSFNGRQGDVVPRAGDYTARDLLVDVNSTVTLYDMFNLRFILAQSSPLLPFSGVLTGTNGIETSGFNVGLMTKPAFPLQANPVPGYWCGGSVDSTGRLDSMSTCTPVTQISGTPNQVIASASTGAVTLSLPQDVSTNANFQAQTVLASSVSATSGISFGSTSFVSTGPTPTAYNWPSVAPTAGSFLRSDAAGSLAWVAPTTYTAIPTFWTTTPATATGTAFSSLFGAGVGSRTLAAGALGPGRRVMLNLGCFTSGNGGGTRTMRVVVGGVTVASTTLGNANGNHAIDVQITLLARSLTAGLSCIVSRGVYARDNGNQAIFSSTGCADVPFGVANAVDVQIAFGSASPTTTCQYAEMIVPRDVAAF